MLYKKLFLIFVFLTVMLTATHLATADYTIANGSATETARVVYSTSQRADRDWPAGLRTQGWYNIEPGEIRDLPVPKDNTLVYIRVERPAGREIKPPDHTTRPSYLFWIHPSEAFTVVENADGDFLEGDHARLSLEKAALYEYRNNGRHTITDVPDQSLPDLPAQQIYNQAIDSMVWIHTGCCKGSGVLIDKERRLAVTNAHVTDSAEWVGAIFPYRDRNRKLIKNKNYYLGDNQAWLQDNGYVNQARVIAEAVGVDLAIIQFDRLPATAREIAHGFGGRVEARMRRGNQVHILGNSGNQLWNWTDGIFLRDLGKWLELESDAEGGISGGPVLNGRGTFIGIISRETDATKAIAVPAREIRALLDTRSIVLPVQLSSFSPKRDPLTGTMVIKWTTESELNNAGFNILRSETKTGEFKVINATMIQGAGTTSEKQHYSYTDRTAKANVSYYYQIEDISFDGEHRRLISATRFRGEIGASNKAAVVWGELKSRQ